MTVITEANTAKARALLAELTLDEKIGMIHAAGLFRTEGVPRLGIPPFRMDDGPMGVRAELHNDSWVPLYNTRDYVTYLPSGSALASTWNPDLAYATGVALGEETRGRGKDVILGPSINIKRSPLCGRNFEYMSEDPVLTAEQAVRYVEGVQESDVAACAKHFAANSQETDRLYVDEAISNRALRELYLPAFEAAVKRAGVLSVMGAYNLVNGVRCCENGWLLDDVLRDEWDFDGFTVSDWSGVKRTKESAEVLTGAVNPSGHLPETFPMTLDDCPAHSIGTFGHEGHVEYTEDIYVGYRYYETKDVPVRFCFGHGLSYTTFEYADLDVRRVDDTVRVACTVTNTGSREGKTVVQAYFGLEGTGEDRPVKELKGFAKVDLVPGESRQVIIDIPEAKALGYWSVGADKWATAWGAAVYVGESVRDIRLTADLD